ncbi:Ig-like domain-containing protein, partial [Candidatus Dojkabacteria bacterium]|nr:Ig-like domain-containing protein [Candidatus Dojkabacteria bacterium]
MRKKRMYIPLNPLLDALPEITRKIREIENKIYILLIAVVLLGGVFAGVNGLNMFGGIYAQQFCPLPAAPAKVLSLVTITPDSEDGVVDCSSLDIIIGAGGTVVVDRYVTENGTSEGDWGVTLLVKSLTVENGGLISADGKGYTNTDDEVVSGKGGNATTTAGGSGGAHGGAGGEGLAPVGGSAPVPGVAYGTEENPSTLGSAGGNSFDGGLGGNGGGSIRIKASEYLVINGQITANGAQGLAQGNSSGGGGAGGSIWIEAESFSGNGIVEAKGGSAQEVTYQGGGGGGGRIIMFCNSSNLFTGSVSVSPGITSLSQDGGIGSRLGPTCIPNEPTLLKQFTKYDPPGATPLQTVEIGQGGVMRTDRLDSVLFVANMSDIDVTDTLTLQIEVRPIGTSFTGIPTHTQSVNMSNPQNCSSPPSGCGTIDIPKAQLPASTEYHWQARIRDNRGGISEWTQFGNNNDGERDFLITGIPTNVLLVSGGNQSGVVGQPLANPMLVRVLDAAGYGVPDQSLTWSIQNGGGTLGSQTSISNTEGVAQNTLTLGVVSGNNSNTVRVSGVGSALDINHSSISDEAVRFSLSTPTVAIRSEEFTFSVIAYDQYNNIATTYDGSPNLSVVNPLNYSQTVGGNFVPSSITFQLGDQGQKVISNATFDTLASIAIKVVDGDIFGYSNAIAIVDTLGQCPDADGIIDSGGDIVWEAGNYPGAIIDCRGLDIVVKSSNTSQVTNLVIRPSLTESVPATLLADSITIESGNSLNSDRRGFTAGQGPGTGCGAAHGGYGVSVSNRGVPYGSVKEPVTMGSGGCTRSYFGNLSVGGEGGGA